ncbi:MAG: polysaccharide deacetylase family protein [Thermoleophilia bacterium]
MALTLMFHAVSPHSHGDPYELTPERFAEILDWIRARGYRAVTQREYLADEGRGRRLLPVSGRRSGVRRLVLLTFDDGASGTIPHVLPVLREFQMPAVFFVPTGLLGVGEQPDGVLPLVSPPVMTRSDLEGLLASGGELGSHGRSHLRLDGLEAARLEEEVRGSYEDLAELGVRPLSIAYPGGWFDHRVEEAARAAGYVAGFTTQVGRGGPYGRRRIPVRSDEGLWALALRLTPLYGVARRTISRAPGRGALLRRLVARVDHRV